MPEDVHDSRNKEDEDARNHQKECRSDEEAGQAATLGRGRGDAEGHDEGFSDGFKEFHWPPILLPWGLLIFTLEAADFYCRRDLS